MEISKNGGLQQHSSAVSYCSITSSREKRRRWYCIKVAPVISVSRVELAAHECQQTEGIDIVQIMECCEQCSRCLHPLTTTETSPLRLAALHQLQAALEHHKFVLTTKQQQLENTSTVTPQGLSVVLSGVRQTTDHTDELSRKRQSIVESTLQPCSDVHFSDVAGLEKAKQAIREAVILPVKFPHLFTGGRQPWRRVLLYGPPGTGKTMLAKAVSGEIESAFYCVSSSDFVSSWVGESEKIIRDLFNHAHCTAGQSVIFIDEVDCICRRRSSEEEEHTRRIKTELLHQMDGAGTAGGEVFLLCATNCPWELDPAFLRRFQRRIYIDLPCRAARLHLLRHHLGSVSSCLSECDWQKLADFTKGYSGSDLANITADALFQPVREMEAAKYWKPLSKSSGQLVPCDAVDHQAIHCCISDLLPSQVQPRPVTVEDYLAVLSTNSPTVSVEELQRYETFTTSMGRRGQQ